MIISSLPKQVGLSPLQQAPSEDFGLKLQTTWENQFGGLAQSLWDATVTVEQIYYVSHGIYNSELSTAVKKQDLLRRLLALKARWLFSQGRKEAGLEQDDQAFSVEKTPSTWFSQGTVRLQLERVNEACKRPRSVPSNTDVRGLIHWSQPSPKS
jgi:hypothetical protein